MNTTPAPLILYSGLAADASVFSSQKIAFPNLIVPEWPIPKPSDTLDSYSERLIAELAPRAFDEPPIIGGASFGGIVAMHVAQRLKPKAVILIGSVQSPGELSRIVRCARPLRRLVGLIPVAGLQSACRPLSTRIVRRRAPHLCGLATQLRRANPKVFKWSLARILDWSETPLVNCPVFHIHGKRDRVMPMRYTQPDEIIDAGGHVISMTHPSHVNEYIRKVMRLVKA